MRLYGKNPVIERLRVNPKSIKKIYMQEGFTDMALIRKKAQQWAIPVFVVPRSKIQKLGRNINTQGITVDVDNFEYIPYPDFLETARSKRRSILFVDGVTDPQNLGAIIRSLACLGDFSLVLPTHDSVSITETVLRVASGGDNYVSISMVANLNNAVKSAREAGYQIVGAMVDKGVDLIAAEFQFPVGIVIGSEEKGVREILRKHLDFSVTIPMHHPTLSYNVAHAAAILCYEITRQRTVQKKIIQKQASERA
jgi:23S rRNA (guanosine2251-2'-O)-methyltransferase